jgi:hypothetical protein
MPRVELATPATGPSIATATATAMPWTVENLDTDNVHAGATAQVVIPAALVGRWQFEYTATFTQIGGVGTRVAYMEKTGTGRWGYQEAGFNTGGYVALSGAASLLCAANDTLTLFVFHSHSAAINVNATLTGTYQGPS